MAPVIAAAGSPKEICVGAFLPDGDPGPDQFVSLALGPLMHASGQWSALGTLLGGGTVVLYPMQSPSRRRERRPELIDAVSITGGHFGAGLGVVELTTAIHYIFDTPRDRLIWDVGHQAYPHKILTGRRDRIRTLRTGGGLSGFTKRTESDYDPFGAAHSSTSISAGLGMAVARDLSGGKNNVIAVIDRKSVV